jgi:NitT/TauT family transport system substrate-binding protein
MKTLAGKALARVGMLTLGGAIIASGLLCAGPSAAQSAMPTLTIKSAVPSLTIAVPLTMVAKKLDEQHGVKADEQASGTSSTIIVDAVLSGQTLFGTPGTADALQAIRQGADLKILGAVVNNLLVAVIRDDVMKKLGVAPDAPIADRIHALKGLTIGTGAVGSTLYQVTRTYLKQYGIDPDKDVRLVGVGETSALISGIEQQRFDVISYASPVVEQAVARHIGSVWFSAPRGDIPGSDNVKMAVVITRTETLQSRKAEVDALLAALGDALHDVRDNHQATGQLLHDTYFPKLDQAVWNTAWDTATTSYPKSLAFTREAYKYWIANDPKGADSYKDVDYAKIVYAPSQGE